MGKTIALYTDRNTEAETPPAVYAALDEEFHFTVDAAASDKNHKHQRYCKRDSFPDGLARPWVNEIVYCNPPYGREIDKWTAKAVRETHKSPVVVVMLLPARTDTAWFHNHVIAEADEIRFVAGRLAFGDKGPAPFPSMIVVFRGMFDRKAPFIPRISTWRIRK